MLSPYTKSVFTYLPKYCEETPNAAVTFINSLAHALYLQAAIIIGTHHYEEPTTVVLSEVSTRKYDLYHDENGEVLDNVINCIMRHIPTHLYPLDHIEVVKEVITDVSMHHITLEEASKKLDAIFVRSTFEQLKTFKTVPGQLDILYRTLDTVAIKTSCMKVDGKSNYTDIRFLKQQIWSIPDSKKDMMVIEFDTHVENPNMVMKDENGDYYTFANGHRHDKPMVTVNSKYLDPDEFEIYRKAIQDAVKTAFGLEGIDIEFSSAGGNRYSCYYSVSYFVSDYIDDETMMRIASYLDQWYRSHGNRYDHN